MVHDEIEKEGAEMKGADGQERILFQALIDAIPDVIGIHDQNHRIIRYNEAGYKLLRMTPEEVRGKECFRLLGKDKPCRTCAPSESYSSKKPTMVTMFEETLGIWFDVRAYPVLDENGNLLYMIEHLRDITREKRSQEELIMEKDRAEFYLDLLGHDIGNLHQGIYTSLQLAEMKKSDAKVQGIALNRAGQITKRSMSLAKTVLLLSRLRSLAPDLEPIDIPDSIRQSMETIHTVFPDRMIDLDIECENECPPVMAEPLIGELFFNLLHNAIKFQRGEIAKLRVEIKDPDGMVEVHISDHGPGIPDKMKATMFRRFKPNGSGSKSGLGLFLVKALVDRYMGTIEVKDRVLGDHTKGARFIVRLPKAEPLQ